MSSRSGSRSRSRSRSPSRRPRITSKRVVVANIPYDVTWNKLKQIFRDRVGFTGFLRLMKTNGRPNGMGVMEFKTIEGAEKAIEVMHRYEIGDRKIIVREETLRDRERMAQMDYDGPSDNGGMRDSLAVGGGGGGGGPMLSQHPSQMGGANAVVNGSFPGGATSLTPSLLERMGIRGPITDSLYISNLDYKVDWKKIKDVFKLAGRVINASIKQDENGRSRGIAVVRFEHPYEALLALAMFNGQPINDRPIRVKIDREGAQVSPHLPVFPPTPAGGAAAASFMAHLNNAVLKSSRDVQPQQHSMQKQQPPFMPQQSGGQSNMAAAAAMVALLGANGNMPYMAAAQFRGGLGGSAPPELINTILNAQQGAGSIAGANFPSAMVAAAAAQRGFPMQHQPGGVNPLSQLIGGGGVGGGGGSGGGAMVGANPGFGGGGMSNRMLDNQSPHIRDSNIGTGGGMGSSSQSASFAGIQQLLMAAAAGGMSQEQIANAAQALGLGANATRDNSAGGLPFFGGGVGDSSLDVGVIGNGSDRLYGNDRGGVMGGGMRRRGDYGDESDSRSNARYSRGSMGGRQSGGGRHIGGNRSSDQHSTRNSGSMYMKRPAQYMN